MIPAPRRTPTEWADLDGVRILDPDGWRHPAKDFTEPISREEYLERVATSTQCHVRAYAP